MSVRPPCAFSDTFHANNLEKGLFRSQEEKEEYEKLERRIKSYIIENKHFDTTIFIVNHSSGNGCEAESEKSRLSESSVALLKKQIEATTGYKVTVHQHPKVNPATFVLGCSISITTPKNKKMNQVVRVMEGAFRAPAIKRAANESNLNS